MLQSPPSVYHDSGFRLQTLMHGRSYLSPIHGTSVVPPHQTSVPAVDSSSQYRGFICHPPPSSHHRLPHFPLSIPPVDILPQYQPHHAGGLGPVGYPPPGMLSSGRPAHHLQPSALDSYSQTLFNLSQQAHISPQTLAHHQNGAAAAAIVQQQVVRQTAGKEGADGTRDVDGGSDRFPLFGMIGYMKPFDGRFSDKNSAQDLSMKASGVSGHRPRHSQTTLKQHSDDSSTSPFCHSQCQPQKHHHHHHPSKSSNTRVPDEIQQNSVNNSNNNNGGNSAGSNRKEYFVVDRFKDEVGSSWRSTTTMTMPPCPVYPMPSEMEFSSSFKDPNSICVHQPSDPRIYQRNGFTNYPSNTTTSAASALLLSSSSSTSLSPPSGVNYGTRSSPLTSASPSSSASVSLYHPPAASGSCTRSPVAYHRHFSRGSVIQLASGQLKRVEELTTEDFLDGRRVRDDLSVNTSRVTHVRLNHDDGMAVIGFAVGPKQIQVTVEAAVEHPFFVFNRGWSSCNPSKTLDHYGLLCLQLSIGDTCISLTHRYPDSPVSPSSDRPPIDEEFPSSPTKIKKSSKGYSKMSPPCCSNQSPEPQMVPGGAVAPPRSSDDDGSQVVVVSPETRLSRSMGQQRGGRKRRWSAPDSGSAERSLAESPVTAYDPLEIDRNAQSPVVLDVA